MYNHFGCSAMNGRGTEGTNLEFVTNQYNGPTSLLLGLQSSTFSS